MKETQLVQYYFFLFYLISLGDDHWCEIESHPCYKGPMSRLVGASESEVCFMNTLSVNLHLMLIVFYKPTPERYKIMIEKKAFPSDYHIVLSQLQLHGYTAEQGLIEIAPREGETTVRLEDIEAILEAEGDKIATVMFSGVQYFTGQFFNIPVITKMAKAKGCRVGFDLAHAVGNVPLHLHDWGVDFACWCMYKYMNSGPGAVAGCFVHEEHGKAVLKQVEGSKYPQPELHRLAGWWGHRQSDRFQMEPVFIPAEGVDGFRLSNPPVMSMACIKASLSVFDKVIRPPSILTPLANIIAAQIRLVFIV
jgi:kynureninase